MTMAVCASDGDDGDDADAADGITHEDGEEITVELAASQDGPDRRTDDRANRCSIVAWRGA